MGWRLTKGCVKANLNLVVGVFVCLLALSFTAIFLNNIATVYRQTVAEDTRVTYGGFAYRIGATTKNAQQQLDSATDDKNLVPVITATCKLDYGESTVDAEWKRSGTGFNYGRLLTGKHATTNNEAEISQALAARRHIGLGGGINCDGRRFQVVGISVLPARRSQVYLSTRLDSPTDLANVTNWVTNTDVANSNYRPLFDRGEARKVSLDYAIRYAQESQQQGFIANALIISHLLLATVGIVLLLGFLAFRRSTAKLRQALLAAGFSSPKTSWFTLAPLFLSMFSGVLLGAVSSYLALFTFSDRIALHFEQVWDGASIIHDYRALLELVASFLTALAAYAFATYLNAYRSIKFKALKSSNCELKSEFIVGLVFLGVGLLCSYLTNSDFAVLYYIVLATIGIGVALLGCAFPFYAYKSPLRLATYRASLHSFILGPIICLLCVLATLGSTNVTMLQRALTFGKPNAESYLTVSFINDADVTYLKTRFPRIMSHAIVFGFPEKPEHSLRIAEGSYAVCIRQNSNSDMCNQWMTLVGFALSENGKELTGKISPELAHTQDSTEYALVIFGPDVYKPEETIPVTLPKNVDERLDYAQLPGWVADPHSPIFSNKGYTIGLERRLYIPDFSRYPSDLQQQFKFAIQQLSSDLVLSEPLGANTQTLDIINWLILTIETGLCLLLIYIGTTITTKNSHALVSTLRDYGYPPHKLSAIRFTQLVPYLVAVVAGPVIGRLMLRPVVAGRALPENVPPDWTWILPAIIIWAVVGLTLVRKTVKNSR
ncbi:MAG: hypothetical protein Q4A71_02670 [Actinomycetaceae bacterium]|nr:hypothetical protein [Actinomycetaceae bacterium]